jgi:hypothetical protein
MDANLSSAEHTHCTVYFGALLAKYRIKWRWGMPILWAVEKDGKRPKGREKILLMRVCENNLQKNLKFFCEKY